MSTILQEPGQVLCDAGTWYVLAKVKLLGARVQSAVARRRAVDPGADDAFRGLYVSDEEVDRLLTGDDEAPPAADASGTAVAELEDEADRLEANGETLPLRALVRRFGLDPVDADLLLVALAPDVDPAFERLYAYLQDDVTLRRPGPALALELAGGAWAALGHRWRLGASGRLRVRGLVTVDESDRPFLTRPVRVTDRVVAHLLGYDELDPAVARVLCETPRAPAEEPTDVGRAVAAGVEVVYVRDTTGAATSAAAAACDACGRPPLVADLAQVTADEDADDLAGALALETALRGGTLLAGPVEAIEARPGLLRALAGTPVPVVLVGSRPWDAQWAAETPLVVETPRVTPEARASWWSDALAGAAPGVDPVAATRQFRLTPDQIRRAAGAARQRAALSSGPVTAADLRHGARLQASSGLDRLADRVTPRARWADLVVADKVAEGLREIAARARHRERVFADWEMGGRGSRRRGVVALFTGPPGTGKTLSAEVVANDLELDLYVVDLASVVDKYVGETEKNLDRIFSEAARVNAVLLFDEADALFGKRSGVEDAHDRYANIEVAYLLQRMESFDGIAVLTSNLRGNLDEAFARRLDVVVELQVPGDDARLRLWEANLPQNLPRSGDVDLTFLVRFKLSGGAIRNACVAAAFRAAADDRPVEMEDLVRGVAQEHAKLGHMCTEAEFGPYYPMVTGG